VFYIFHHLYALLLDLMIMQRNLLSTSYSQYLLPADIEAVKKLNNQFRQYLQ